MFFTVLRACKWTPGDECDKSSTSCLQTPGSIKAKTFSFGPLDKYAKAIQTFFRTLSSELEMRCERIEREGRTVSKSGCGGPRNKLISNHVPTLNQYGSVFERSSSRVGPIAFACKTKSRNVGESPEMLPVVASVLFLYTMR